MKQNSRLTVFLSLVALLLVPLVGATQELVQAEKVKVGQLVESERPLNKMQGALRTIDGRVRIIVELVEPSVASYRRGIPDLAATSPQETGRRKLDFGDDRSREYAGFLKRRQKEFEAACNASLTSARIDHRYQNLLNGVAMTVDPNDMDAVRNLPGVRAVYPDTMVYETMDASLPLINAKAMWWTLGGRRRAGKGMKVAVIDSGIRPENPMFDGSHFHMPAGYPLSDDYCATTDPSLCNGKIIVARYYEPTFTIHVNEKLSPIGLSGHGTHTAGSAVGNLVRYADAGDGVLEKISGVAPGAQLMVYKALFVEVGDDTYRSGGTSAMLIAALEDAVKDGADVINNSWGGSAGASPESSPYGGALQAAEDAGVVVVFSAGNSGPGSKTIGCPGCFESVITVGASTTNRIHGLPFSVNGVPDLTDLGAQIGTGPEITGDIGPAPIVYAGDVDPANFEGCASFAADSMTDAFALISRGSCSFAIKVDNAAAAGATAVVVFNSRYGTPIVMGALEATTIPSVMISRSDGEAVRDWVQANPGAEGFLGATATRVTNNNWQDIMGDFSSRGPNGDPDVLKPDIVAPGVNILSGYNPEIGGMYTFLQGTSMAAPHVAGAAALILQQHPDWTPAQVKTALTSTAIPDLRKEDGETPTDPLDMGAGRIDLKRAKRAGATFDKPSMAEDNCFMNCSWTRTIRNERRHYATWKAKVEVSDPNLNITVTPRTLNLDKGESASFTVEADTSLLTAGQWYFGTVVWSSWCGAPDARLPVAVYAGSTTGGGEVLLTKTVDMTEVFAGDKVSYEINLLNQVARDPIVLRDVIPDNATFVPGSAEAIVDGNPDPSFSYDPGTNSLNWSGTLAPAAVEVTPSPSPFGYAPLDTFGVAPLPCSSVCDDTSITLTGLPSFTYLGDTYSSVVMSSNGFIVVGDDTTNAWSPFNQNLPDAAIPNNVVAPFWTDLDMDGTSDTDSGAGTWYAGILTDGVSFFTILEWQGAELYGVPGVPFTFQIWIEAGTSNIWYVYAGIPGIPSFLTVGAENDDGLSGTNYYFDGTGTPPAVGTDLTVGFTAAGLATFTFQVEAGTKADPFINVVEATSGGLTVKSRSPAVFVDYRTTTLCSNLGIDGWRPDRDFFKFEGIEGETITLRMDPDGDGSGRATLAVWGSYGSHFFKMERGNLPHEIVATLPKTGTYWIMVDEHHRRWKHGDSFRGPYCLSLKSARSDTLEPGYMVE